MKLSDWCPLYKEVDGELEVSVGRMLFETGDECEFDTSLVAKS